ncbi:MAG: thiol reductase thioredoxin [Clostridia bacterium]|nr:thiol reductase thioredoxin [Clostridia bacterium]
MNEDIIRADSYDFEERVQIGIVMVYFYEHLNVESRVLEPIIGEIAERYIDDVTVLAVDMEQSPDIAVHYAVESSPCVIIFRNGEPVEIIDGANPTNVYCDCLDEMI